MVEADKLLDDDELIDLVWAAQGERHEQSATRGRPQTPAEIALRLLLLKHVRNWGFETLEREVRAVYEDDGSIVHVTPLRSAVLICLALAG